MKKGYWLVPFAITMILLYDLDTSRPEGEFSLVEGLLSFTAFISLMLFFVTNSEASKEREQQEKIDEAKKREEEVRREEDAWDTVKEYHDSMNKRNSEKTET